MTIFFSPGIKSFVKRVEEIEELKWRAAPSNDLEPCDDYYYYLRKNIMIMMYPSISVKQTVAESNISEVFLAPLRLSATVLRE